MSSPAAETSLQPLRLKLDVALEQSNAQLRLAAAVVAGVAGIWLAWVEHTVWLRLTALVSAAFAARWIMKFRSTARLARSAPEGYGHFLEITTQRVTLATGTGQRVVPLASVARIELDEDRLAVVLCLLDGEELAIEPVYGSLGLHDLGDTLQRYLSAQRHPSSIT